MRRPIPCWLAVLVVLTTMGTAAAQPPAYERWENNTAIAPTQGNYLQGTPMTLTWGFMAPGTAINDSSSSGFANGNNNLQTRLNTIYGSQATWQPLFQSSFDRWAAVSGLSYQFEANDDGAAINSSLGFDGFPNGVAGRRPDVRIGGKALDGNGRTLAYNYFPTIGEMVIDTNDTFYNNTANNSIGLRNVVTHEHGHGVGMDHVESNNAAFLMEPFIDTSFDGPQFHDILAAQHMYGDAREKSNAGLGNDTAARANSLDNLTSGSSVSIGNSARSLAVAATATDFVSIDSETDTDFYSFTVGGPSRVSAALEALGFTYNLTPQGDGLNGDVPFDTKRRSDLRLGLFSTDGSTLLSEVNNGGLGETESLTFDLAEGGTYFLRILGTNNPDAILLDTQFYALAVELAPVPEPAAVLLVASIAAGGWAARRRRQGCGATA